MRSPSTASRQQLGLLPSEWPESEKLEPAQRKSAPEELFALQCRQYRLPKVERQLMFAKGIGRRWMFDFAFLEYHLAVEIEGMAVERRCPKCYPKELIIRGRHGSIGGINGDMKKYNTAALLGWTVLRFATKDVKPEHAIVMTQRVLAARGWRGIAHEHTSTAAAADVCTRT